MLRTYRSLESRVLGVVVAGFLVESALTVLSVWVPTPDGGYGAPVEVGHTVRLLPFSDPQPTTFNPLIFALDVAVAGLLFLWLARWSGWLGVVLGTVAAIGSLVLAIVMAFTGLPVIGLPIPLFRSNPLSPSLVLWLDMVFWATVVAALVRRGRRRLWVRSTRDTKTVAGSG